MSDAKLAALRETSKRRTRGEASRCAVLAALALGAAVLANGAYADICKYIDPQGNTHYSNLPPEKGWRRLGCTVSDNSPLRNDSTVARAPATSTPTPQGFPRIDASTQKGRDDMRKKVLSDELAAEEKLLAESRSQYADGAPPPLPEERADAEKYRARIGRLRQAVSLHEKNIEALRKELAAVK